MIGQGAKQCSLFCFVSYVMGDLLSEVFFAAIIQTLSERLDFQPVLLYTYHIAITRRSTYGHFERYGGTHTLGL